VPQLKRSPHTGSAARLVYDVVPRVPVGQWVLSLPHRLRYLLAWDHDLSRALNDSRKRLAPLDEIRTIGEFALAIRNGRLPTGRDRTRLVTNS